MLDVQPSRRSNMRSPVGVLGAFCPREMESDGVQRGPETDVSDILSRTSKLSGGGVRSIRSSCRLR